jgi:serine protease Do
MKSAFNRRPLGPLVLGWVLFLILPLTVHPAVADQAGRVTPTVRVVRQAGPAVVNISTTSRQRIRPFQTGDPRFDRFFEDFFRPMERESHSLGSGVIIDGKSGLIATNYHVVSQATEIKVMLSDRRSFQAQLVGADPNSDLAVLRIRSAKPLPQVRLGDSNEVMIGERVIAIGNPFKLSHTVTTGVVSAVQRRVRTSDKTFLSGLIQTDASINPGNSGGPLLNVDGEVIGINTAIYQQAQGIGFAIPVNRVRRVAEDLVRYGEVIPAWLGIELQDLTPSLARAFGLSISKGAVVKDVMKDSPAQKSGIIRGHVVVAVNRKPLKDSAGYSEALAEVRAGDKVSLTLLKQGRRQLVKVQSKAFPLERANELAWRLLGFTVVTMDLGLANRHRVRPGSAVAIDRVRPGSRAEEIGLHSGDLVRRLGEKNTISLKAFQQEIARNRLASSFTFLVQRGRASQYITLRK